MTEINVTKADVLDFLADTIKNLLQIDNVNDSDDFFMLGGDSLAAIDLIALIQKQYQIKLELVMLFENRTLAKLSHVIIEQISNTLEKTDKDQIVL